MKKLLASPRLLLGDYEVSPRVLLFDSTRIKGSEPGALSFSFISKKGITEGILLIKPMFSFLSRKDKIILSRVNKAHQLINFLTNDVRAYKQKRFNRLKHLIKVFNDRQAETPNLDSFNQKRAHAIEASGALTFNGLLGSDELNLEQLNTLFSKLTIDEDSVINPINRSLNELKLILIKIHSKLSIDRFDSFKRGRVFFTQFVKKGGEVDVIPTKVSEDEWLRNFAKESGLMLTFERLKPRNEAKYKVFRRKFFNTSQYTASFLGAVHILIGAIKKDCLFINPLVTGGAACGLSLCLGALDEAWNNYMIEDDSGYYDIKKDNNKFFCWASQRPALIAHLSPFNRVPESRSMTRE